MKKRFLTASLVTLLLTIATVSFGQAIPPKIIVFPSDGWCQKMHYGSTVNEMGTPVFLPDYATALRSNQDMKDIVGALEIILKDNGLEVKSLEGTLNSLRSNAAYDMVHTSKDGSALAETPIEQLLSTAQPDIIVKVGFEEMRNGPKTAIRFNLDAYDAYTNDPIDNQSGHGTSSSNSFDKVNQLQEAVLSFKDLFLSRIQNHFDDMFSKGRKVSIQVYRWESCPIDFEEEYGDDELGDLIEEWMSENAVSGRFTTAMATENRIIYDGVRIPMYNKKNKAMNAKDFAKELAKYINSVTGQTCKVETKGLGLARVTMGGK